MELPGSICWGECYGKGGKCLACESHDQDAFSGYCCSGVNHHGGGGPASNGDCPTGAVDTVQSIEHACVVQKSNIPKQGTEIPYIKFVT